MSLSNRRVLNSVHPWVADRIRYILDYADNWNPRYSITSGVRTAPEQFELYRTPGLLAAQVGCSQHQYGFATDVSFEDPNWQNWYLASARNFGLITVAGDDVHVQAFLGSTFREVVADLGYCPDRRYHGPGGVWGDRTGSNSFRRGVARF